MATLCPPLSSINVPTSGFRAHGDLVLSGNQATLLGSGLPTHVLRYGPASDKADKSFPAEA